MYASLNPSTITSLAGGGGEEALGARARLRLTLSLCPEDDPRDRDVGVAPRESEQRAAAADLDVVGVTADRKHAAERRSVAEGREGEHQAGLDSLVSLSPT